MKLSTKKLPLTARLFIKVAGVEVFNGLVVEYVDELNLDSDSLIRVRQFGMTPIEYGGSSELIDGVYEPVGYRDLIIPEAMPDLPIDEDAKVRMDKAIAEQEDKKAVIIGHSDE